MGELLSGSRLPIARHCGYSFRSDVTFPDNRAKDDDDDAARGSRSHELFSAFVETGLFPPLTPSQKTVCDHVRKFWDSRGRWAVESAYALDPAAASARFLGSRINRKYEVMGDEIPLTLDYCGYEEGLLVIGDWKGFGAHVDPAKTNLQLLACALAVSMVNEKDGRPIGEVVLEIPHVTEEGIFLEREKVSVLRLHAALVELKVIKASIPGSEAFAGEHCRYCTANGACPATSDKLAIVASSAAVETRSVGSLARWTSEFISIENDRALLSELGAVKKALEAIERAVKDRNAGGIDMGDGSVYKSVVCRRTVPDTKKIEEKLGDEYLNYTKLLEYEQFRRVKA